MTNPGPLRVEGPHIAAGDTAVARRGFGRGGQMNSERLITGCAGLATIMRRAAH